MSVDLKILTPDSSINDSALLFGAESQASASPSVYTVSTLKTHILSSGFSDGSAAAPSITNEGDLNTGFFFPANDTIAASTGGSERMRIDSSGNVGIGASSPDTKLNVQVSSTGRSWSPTGGLSDVLIERVANSGINITSGNAFSGYLTFGDTDDENAGVIQYFHNEDAMIFRTGGSERMRITGSGNVGIGTSSPAHKLQVSATDLYALHAKVYDTVGDQSLYGIYLDYNGSGSDTLTASRNHWAMYIDMDITATGGDTTNEYKAYGQYIDLLNTGDPDAIYGIHPFVRTNHTSGTVTLLYAANNFALIQNTGEVTYLNGSRNTAYVNFTGAQSLNTGYGTSCGGR